tara:strand:- start:440 stop:2164 length:1725 start_codon:yes stop_codon:yes gene_type:complete
MININDIHKQFKLPICYLENTKETPPIVSRDLELKEYTENPENCLYDHVFNPKTNFGKEMLQQWSKYYTTNINYLKDNQKLIKDYSSIKGDTSSPENCKKVFETWQEIKNDIDFKEKYQYIEWHYLEFLNKSPMFLEMLSLYTLTSPVLSLLSPVLLLIVPFFILKINNQNISINSYFSHLINLFKNIPIGRIFNLHNLSWEKRIYSLISIIFYFVQVYQNVQFCYRFKRNMLVIHNYIDLFKNYVGETIKQFTHFTSVSSIRKSFNLFNETIDQNRLIFIDFKEELDKITPHSFSVQKLSNIGHVMKIFYEIYDNTDYHNAMLYSFGFNGYIENLTGLKQNIKNKFINKCRFSGKNLAIKDGYYAPIPYKKAVKNSYNINNNIIITGPNAAGKTTILKSTIFNILLSQQIGFGFYRKADIIPFDYFHCYINIPDTAGRDSLFQAEARRCKEILDTLDSNKDKRHLCIFDELYSGTNPYEAISSAYAYLTYLNQNKKCRFILTTHYIQLCEIIQDKTKTIQNKHMNVIEKNGDFEYSYKFIEGVSNIKGGIKVLKDLQYPPSIIENTQKILVTL